jgi:hypothetical protein
MSRGGARQKPSQLWSSTGHHSKSSLAENLKKEPLHITIPITNLALIAACKLLGTALHRRLGQGSQVREDWLFLHAKASYFYFSWDSMNYIDSTVYIYIYTYVYLCMEREREILISCY